jgi:hypothetical protein
VAVVGRRRCALLLLRRLRLRLRLEQPGPLVAGAVATERLERGELPAARLALEHAPVRPPRRWERHPVVVLQEVALLLLLRLREEHEQAGRVRGAGAGVHLPRCRAPLGHG